MSGPSVGGRIVGTAGCREWACRLTGSLNSIMHRKKNLIILTIDGLASRDLGPYGNTWVETPGFNSLASRAWLAETMISPRPELGDALRAMLRWGEDRISVLGGTAANDWNKWLLIDRSSAELAKEFVSEFDSSEELELPLPAAPAARWEETHFAQFMARLLELRDSAPEPYLLWGHYAGLGFTWDAPTEWRRQLELDEEVEAPEWIEPPRGSIDPQRDSDRRLQILWAWAAQVMVVDRCLEILWDSLLQDDDADLIVTSPRGFPLGEHGQVGFEPSMPYSETTAVPCLACDGSTPAGWRERQIVASGEVARLIGDWLNGQTFANPIGERPPQQIIHCQQGKAIRRSEWLLVRRGDSPELYVKPDDRWEANDVSQRCHEVVEELGQALEG